jgi:hypothetical protein
VGSLIGDGCISISYRIRKEKLKKGIFVKKTKGNIFRYYRRFWFIERIKQVALKRIARFGSNPSSICYGTYFSLTGDRTTNTLFQAVRSTFGVGQLLISDKHNSSVFRISGWKNAKNFVFPFLDNTDLPSFRQEQFQNFKLLLPYFEQQAYCNQKNVKKLVKLLYKMNRRGYFRRQTERKILHSFRIFFKTRKKFKESSKLHKSRSKKEGKL